MSHEASRWAWRLELPMRDKFVLLALADWADEEGLSYPSRKTLVKKCGLSLGSVQRALVQLTDWGLIEKTEQFRKNKSQTVNLYQLRLDRNAPIEVAEAARAASETEPDEGGINLTPPLKPESESGESSIDWGDSSGPRVQADSPPGDSQLRVPRGLTAESPMTRHLYSESTPYPLKGEAASLAPQERERASEAVKRVEAQATPERTTRAGFWELHERYQAANWLGFVGNTDRAIKRWDALTLDERLAALAKFPAYVRSQKAQWRAWKDANPSSRSRQPKPSSMEDYLGNRLFRDLPAPIEEPPGPKACAVDPAWADAVKAGKRTQFDPGAVFVAQTYPGFAAWIAAERRAGVTLPPGPRSFPGIGHGRYFVSALPPAESDFVKQENKTEKVDDGIQARSHQPA